ncbi:MAG: LytR family transcriptional regulator [Ruminococcaceae bacterium]|nr:LytR family transcriptional regulator [Oscillospiraceae bacterium]
MSKQKTTNLSRAERACRALVIVLMGVAALWGAWRILVPKPGMNDGSPSAPSSPTSPANPAGVSVSPSGDTAEGGETKNEAEDLYARKPDCWTFLLVGMDKGSGNTDSLMLVTYDVANQSVSIASIARDTRVDVDRKLKKINAAYAFGGMDGLLREVSQTFGIPVDYYFRVNINGFVRLVNAVDGVDFSVPCYMDYDDPYQDLSIHYSKGMQHLNGQQALEVCRFRQNNDGSGYGDEGRQKTQRGVLTAVIKKALSRPDKLNDYAAIAADNLETNLPLGSFVWFATKALSINAENLNTMSMPCEWISPYMYLKPEETLEVVNEYLNPYTTPRTADMLDIITR